MILRPLLAAALVACLPVTAAFAAEATVTLKVATPQGEGGPVGTVTMEDTKYGLVFTPKLTGLPPGLHGFHVHANPSCAVASGSASLDHAASANTPARNQPPNTIRMSTMRLPSRSDSGVATKGCARPSGRAT